MSAKIKRAGAKTAKALGIVFFLFLIVFNVQLATSNEQSSDINLLGLSLSVFTPSAVASEVEPEFNWKLSINGDVGDVCPPRHYLAGCIQPGSECSSVANPECYPYPDPQ